MSNQNHERTNKKFSFEVLKGGEKNFFFSTGKYLNDKFFTGRIFPFFFVFRSLRFTCGELETKKKVWSF